MTRFDIAGICMEVISQNQSILDKFIPFESCFKGEADLIVNIKDSVYINKPVGNSLLIAQGIEWLADSEKDNVIVCIYNWITGKPLCIMNADYKWSRIDISYLKDSPGIDYAVSGMMFNIIIRNRVLFNHGIVIHASAIDYNGKGIIFSAPSGTGKSTQACLWEDYMGARVLNDDCPVVKMEKDGIKIYGTPCSGSKDKFINSSANLSAVIILEQSLENSIRALSKYEAVTYLMPRCFLAYYDKKLMKMAINNFEEIINLVPVYLLRCRPDLEAVELVYQYIK